MHQEIDKCRPQQGLCMRISASKKPLQDLFQLNDNY